MKPTRLLLLGTAAALLALNLGACSRDEPDATPTDNIAIDKEPDPAAEATSTPPALPTRAEPTTADVNASAEMEPEPATAPDEQMLDDASATGMTARAARDEQAVDPAPVTGNEGQ